MQLRSERDRLKDEANRLREYVSSYMTQEVREKNEKKVQNNLITSNCDKQIISATFFYRRCTFNDL